ncbi:MAG: tetratricopeptide repeat protein [Rhodothermales bacterium]
MDSERWERIQALFIAALDLEPAEGAAFLDEACADDPALRREVETMLKAHEDSYALAIENRLLDAEPLEGPNPEFLLGTRIGPYRLQRLLGQGGMGEVYLAERDDAQYQQQVALKLIRTGLHTADVARRFRAERQILARLIHPHVARLLDGGVADDGRPYLVMEYVEGVPLTTFCDANRLSIEERLRLFGKVCTAVQFAHRNLVVHRDLKPSNILVTGDGQVKLLDFGIAKLLDPEATAVSVALTRADLRLMTPEYAAPEQVRGEAVTTATDVYALGVLLYELLTGHRPYRLPGRVQAEIERIICEKEPTRPSTVIIEDVQVRKRDGTTETLTPERIGAARRTPVGRLQRLLRGDLDNIVMMALRKEAERRYVSAGQLGEDVDRYLAGRPVIAQKDTLGYRARTFIRRNRVGVGVAATFVLLLIGFSVVTAWQARTVARERDAAQTERDKAEQVVQVLVNLFASSNPTIVPGGDTLRVGEFLEQGEARVLEELKDQPEIQARMKQVLGDVYQARSQYDRARTLLEEALAQQRALKGPQDPIAAGMLHSLAFLTRETGDLKTAEAMLRESLALHRAIFGDRHERVAQAMQDLAAVTEDDEEQRLLLTEALAMRRAVSPDDLTHIAASLNQLGIYHFGRDEYEEAGRLWREALDILKQLYGEDHPHVMSVMNNLSAAYSIEGSLDEAEAITRRLLASTRKIMGSETASVASVLNNLATILAQQGNHAEAEADYRESHALWVRLVGEDHRQVANTARNIGRLLQLQQQYDEALPYLQDALAISRRLDGETHRITGYMMGQLGMVLLDLDRLDEALHTVQEAVRIIENDIPEKGHFYLADGLVWLGRAFLAKRVPDEAEAPLRRALAYRVSTLRADHPKIAEARCLLGRALAMQGRHAEAEPLLREGYPIFSTWGMAETRLVEQARLALVETYMALGQPEQAADYR